MKYINIIISFICLFIIQTVKSENSEQQVNALKIEEHETYPFSLLQGAANQVVIFDPKDKEDIMLTVLPADKGSFKKITFEIVHKNLKEDTVDCNVDKMYGFCLLPPREIEQYKYKGTKGTYKKHQVLKINIICQEGPCDFNLVYTNSNYGEVIPNGVKEIPFETNKIQMFDIRIPHDFERIIVPIQFMGIKRPVVELCANIEQEEDVDGKQDFYTKHIIDNFLVFEFRNFEGADQSKICQGCHYTVQLISDIGTTAIIQQFEFIGSQSPIKLNEVYIDSILENQPQTYEINFDGNYSDIEYVKVSFKFIEEDVHAPLYINGVRKSKLGPQSDNDEEALKTLFENTALVSNSKEAQVDQERNKEYSIIFNKIKGNDFSDSKIIINAFSFVEDFISIQAETFKKQAIPLQIDQIFNGNLSEQKNQSFVFQTPNFENLEENKQKQVKLVLKQTIGQSNLVVQTMKNESDFSNKSNNQSAFQVQALKSQQSAQFKPECDKQNPYCYYLITVNRSPNSQEEISSYLLEALYTDIDAKNQEDSDILELDANQGFSDIVLENQFKDYVFNFDNSKNDIKKITISVSTHLVQLYVAPKSKCKLARSDCKNIKYGTDKKPVVVTKLKNTFAQGIVIGVKGYKPTDFSITVEVDRIGDSPLIELENAHSTSSELSLSSPIKYFNFFADLEEDEDIIINLKGPSNKLIITVNNDDTFPTFQDDESDSNFDGYIWNSRTNYLIIKHTFKDYLPKANYIIGVQAVDGVLETSSHSLFQSTINFKIMASSSKSVKILDFNEAFFDFAIPQGIQYYEIMFNPKNVDDLYFQRNILNDESMHEGMTFYIGSDLKQNVTQFEYPLPGEDKAVFELNRGSINRICGYQNDELCTMYIAAQNTGKRQIQYSLTLWEKSLGVELKEGFQYEYHLYHIDGYMNFYYIPTDFNNAINFHLYSFHGNTNFTVKVFDNNLQKSMSEWPFPKDQYGIQEKDHKNKNIDYTSAIHHSHSITIHQDKVKQMNQNTVILISVSFMDQDDEQYSNPQIQGKDKFTLLVSSKFQQIHPGQRTQFTLDLHESKYSFMNIRNAYNKKENIYLQLTALSGKSMLYVTLQDDNNERMPSTNYYDWSTSSNYLEITYKELKELFKEYDMKTFTNPQLVIQVQSVISSGKFNLAISTDSNNALNLLHGMPEEYHLAKNTTKTYRYYNYIGQDIQIRLNRDYGFGYFSVLSCQEWDVCLDGEDSFKFMSGVSGSLLEIKKGDSLWCQDCYFMIKLTNHDEFSEIHGFLYVLLDKDPIWLQEGRNFIDNNDKQENNLYRISAPSNEDINISLTVYWGNPRVFINYYYATESKDFSQGPYKKGDNGIIHLKIPARDDIMDEQSKKKHIAADESDKLIIGENDIYTNLVENEIFILVENYEKSTLASNYTISYTAGEQERYLSDGHIQPFNLEGHSNISFIHQHYDDSNMLNPLMSINLENYHDVDINNINITTHLQEQKSRVVEGSKIEYIQLQQISKSNKHITYALPNRSGAYKFHLNNLGNHIANLTIYVNTRDITLLPQDHKIQHYLQEKQINYYEVIVPYSGFIAIDLDHCMGDLDYGYTQDINKFTNDKFDNVTAEPSVSGMSYLDVIPVKKGNFYLALITYDEPALYSLKVMFYKKEELVPHYKLDAGKEGFIEVIRDETGHVQLEFSPIQCNGCSDEELKQSRVTYTVIWTSDLEILNVMGKCGMEDFFDHNKQEMNGYSFFEENLNPLQFKHSDEKVQQKSFSLSLQQTDRLNHTFPIQDIDNTYWVSIKSVIHNFPKATGDITILYNNVEISPVSSYFQQGGLEKDLMVLGGVTLLIFGVLVFSLIVRRLFRPSTKPNRFQRQQNTDFEQQQNGFNRQDGDSLDNSFQDDNHISILDTSTPARNNFDEDLSPKKDFTFSKKLANDEGKEKFSQFEDEI